MWLLLLNAHRHVQIRRGFSLEVGIFYFHDFELLFGHCGTDLKISFSMSCGKTFLKSGDNIV